ILALWMERRLGKEEILSRYLNTAYFGAGVYGVDAAAKRYFGKTAKELSLSEAAMLAGLGRAPSALAPTRHLEEARQPPAAGAHRRVGDGRALWSAGGCGAAASRHLAGAAGEPAGNELFRRRARRRREAARRLRIRGFDRALHPQPRSAEHRRDRDRAPAQ